MKYKGNGFLRGVPARDLKEDEVRKFGAHYLVRSGLYELVKPEPVRQAPDSTQEAPAEQPKRKSRKSKGE
jgi:hypothetical protein